MSLQAARQRGPDVATQPGLPRAATSSPLRLTLGLLVFFLANAFLLNGLIWSASPEPHRITVLKHSWDLLRGEGGDDSWGAMQVALDHAAEIPDVPLYTKVFFTDNFRFQYPPSALFSLSAMLAVDPERVQINDVYDGVWPAINTIVGWVFIALTAVSAAGLLEVGLASAQPDVEWRQLRPLRAAVVVGLTLTFYPVVKAFTLGQIQVWINALFALGLLAWAAGWKVSSGVLIGAISLIKPHYALFLVWAALRREMRFAAACAVTIGVGLAASVSVYGLANHFDYLRVLSFLSQHGETYYPNQSINGVLNRLLSISDPQAFVSLDLPAGKFPPFTLWIWAATLATSLGLLLFGLLRPFQRDDHRVIDLSSMAVCCTMASPIAWEHHYGVTLPIFAVLLATCLGDRSRLMWLGISYVLVSTFVPAANLLAERPLNPLQSTLFAGAIVLLVLLGTHKVDGSGQCHRKFNVR
jgi:alpha-1,2-mannosyltransferase